MEIQTLIDDLALHIGKPITLEDSAGKLLAYSLHEEPLDSVRMETLLRRGASPATLRAIKDRGVYRTIDAADGVAIVSGIAEIGLLPRLALAVRSGGRVIGYLWIGSDSSILSPQVEQRLIQAERALREAIGSRSSSHARPERRESLLSDLVSKGHPPGEFKGEVQALGWMEKPPFQILVLRPSGDDAEAVLTLVSAALPSHLCGIVGGDAVVLLSGEEVGSGRAVETVAERCKKAQANATLGLGAPYPDLTLVARSYDEALAAIGLGARFRLRAPCHDYRTLSVYDLVHCLPRCKKQHSREKDAVMRLQAYDEMQGSDLFVTLMVYLDLYGQRKAAAKRLNIHPNTLDYRIKKIETITSIDPNDPLGRLALHIWTKALRFPAPRLPGVPEEEPSP